jgi:gliding motility-associated-like protein
VGFAFNALALETPKQSLSFKENKGQISDQFYKPRPDVLFSGTDGKINFHLRNNGISYQLSRVDSWTKKDIRKMPGVKREEDVPEQITMYRVDINWLNASKKSIIKKSEPLPGYDNYYLEVCPNGAINVQSYKQITYQDLYKGIDLKWYEKNGNLKYDYIVSPGSDYHQIQFEIKGAEKISLNDKGQLILKTPLGEIVEESPLVTQNGKILSAKWIFKNNVVSFDIKNVDASQSLIIDPLVRLWGTYYGGTDLDAFWYCLSDAANNVYASGLAESLNNIASVGAYQTVYGGAGSSFWQGDAMLVKFDPNGVRLWGTYFGGAGSDFTHMLHIDLAGDISLVGMTSTTNSAVMATPGAHQTLFGGGTSWGDAFVAKFDVSGSRIWSTYYGGTGDEWAIGISGDATGNLYISLESSTPSGPAIASPGAYQISSGGGMDAVLAKFNSAGVRQWGTFYGGTGFDNALGCATDAAGNTYIVGQTASPNAIASPGSHQTGFGGFNDGYIAKFDPSGNRLWATYYGGTGNDHMIYVAIGGSGNVYVTGSTSTPGGTIMATPGSHQPNYNGGGSDCFLAKFTPLGSRVWSTYYGGNSIDQYAFVSVSSSESIYISGETATASGTEIATPCTYQLTNGGGGRDAFLAKFNASGVREWGTFYGGQGTEDWGTCSVNSLGEVYICGRTSTPTSTVIADPASHQPSHGGGASPIWDGYLVKFDGCKSAVMPNTTSPPDMTVCIGENTQLTTTMSVCGLNWFDAPGGNVIGTNTIYATPNLSFNTTFYIGDISCGTPDTLTPVEVTVTPLPNMGTIVSSTVLCAGGLSTLTAVGAMTYTWLPVQVIGSVLTVTASSTTIYSVTGFDGSCYNSTTVTVEAVPFATLNLNYQQNPTCFGTTVSLSASGAQTYSWYPPGILSASSGSLVNTVPLQNNSTFTVVGFNSSGPVTCSTSSSFFVNVLPQIVASISPSTEVCEGSKTTLAATGGNTYSWLGQNIEDPVQSIVVVTPTASGIYQANVSYNNICPVTATVFVKVNPKPNVFAGNDTTINIGDPVFISANGNGILKWISGENIGCVDCPSTHVLPYTKSCYVVEATDTKGCKAQDDVCIEIINDYAVYIPNTFTPNGDDVNDIFYVYGFGIKDYKMTIYDRWGIKLFTSTDQTQGWNGIYNGEICEQGTYIYYVEFTPYKGKHEIRPGHVNIIRGKP